MGFEVVCTESKFRLGLENMADAMRCIAPTKYRPDGVSESAVLEICDSGKLGAIQDLFIKTLLKNGYSLGFDGKGNARSVHHSMGQGFYDKGFFDVFAQHVEKGSYIEFTGGAVDLWRLYFDGERCQSIEPVIAWPGMEEAPKKIEVDLGYAKLVAETGYDDNYREIFLGLEDKDGNFVQDLAIVGCAYHYEGDAVIQDKGIAVKVFSDKDNEDYTHEFAVEVYEPEKEEELCAGQVGPSLKAVLDAAQVRSAENKELHGSSFEKEGVKDFT